MTDLELRKAVESELNFEPSINAAEIGVAAKDGIITLSGSVPSYWEKMAAERAAARVSGVKAVVNEVEVHLPGSSERTDEDIARAAINAFQWSVLVPPDRIRSESRRDGSHWKVQSIGNFRRRQQRKRCVNSLGSKESLTSWRSSPA